MPLFDQLTDRVSAALWNLCPSRAVRLGKHEYDGVVPDLSADALAAGYDRLRRLRVQLTALTGLTAEEELDRMILLGALDTEVLDGEVLDEWHRQPLRYLTVLDVGPYLGRDYAPAGLRTERAVAVLQAAPEVLSAARVNLDPVLSRPAVERARRQGRRLAGRLAGIDPGGEEWLHEAAAGAADEVQAFVAWLEAERLPAADEGFAVGAEVIDRVLRGRESLERSLDELTGLARAALAVDGASPGQEATEQGVSGPGNWGEALQSAVEEARRFVADSHLVTIPATCPLEVREHSFGWSEGPEPDLPGPYDDPAAGAVLYADEPAARRAGEADDLAVAVAYPGCLLQSLHAARAPTEVARRFASRSFREGWALYAGEAMWEAGYRGTDRRWRERWLDRARRAACRLVCARAMHGGAMPREEAEAFFVEHGHCDRETARLQTEWVAADPGSAAAALGRLEILEVHRRWRERMPSGPIGAFHDALLSRGAPPVGLLDRVVWP